MSWLPKNQSLPLCYTEMNRTPPFPLLSQEVPTHSVHSKKHQSTYYYRASDIAYKQVKRAACVHVTTEPVIVHTCSGSHTAVGVISLFFFSFKTPTHIHTSIILPHHVPPALKQCINVYTKNPSSFRCTFMWKLFHRTYTSTLYSCLYCFVWATRI